MGTMSVVDPAIPSWWGNWREALIIRLADPAARWSIESSRVPLGPLSEVRVALESVFGVGTWQAPEDSALDGEGWCHQGVFRGEGFYMLAKIGPEKHAIVSLLDSVENDPVESITLELRGASDLISCVRQLCAARSWQAIDLQSLDFITPQTK